MYVDRIAGSARRMRQLIEDLLLFSRVGGAAEPRPVDCGLALRSVLDSLPVALAEAPATVTHDSLPIILANRTPIQQLFQNLIGNALKYRSEAPPRIHVAAEELDGARRLTITDNGIGIDMTHAERDLPGVSAPAPAGRYEGTGIDMTIRTHRGG
jgi:light-regulated signal transduction histidine kinase (bacteriophytochrome)